MTTAHTSAGCTEYQALSRRGFIGITAAAVSAPAWLPRVAYARDHRSAQRDVILSIFLRGASDGLSLCVPHAEPAYYAARPTIAVPRPDSTDPNKATDLNGFFGFPKALTPLLPAYADGKLLVVHAAGSKDPSRSHFDAQRFMEVGKPRDLGLNTGWLGRHLASTAPMDTAAALRAVGISTGLPTALQGGPATLPIPDLDNFGLTGSSATKGGRLAVLGDLYDMIAGPVHDASQTTLKTIGVLDSIDFANYVPANGAVYPAGNFGTAVKSCAALIKAQVGVEAIAVDLQGWDTHDNQGTTTGTLNTLMGTLAATLAAFYADVIASSAPSVTVTVMSEFGRQLKENGSVGTDHGHGNVMFIMGRCVAGGQVLTQWPGLSEGQLFEGRDLEVTIDYRDILAEILQKRLGSPDLPFVFPDFTPNFRNIITC